MKCPKCGGVTIIRKTEDRKDSVNRFRTCKSCFTNFVTEERLKHQTGSSRALKEKIEP